MEEDAYMETLTPLPDPTPLPDWVTAKRTPTIYTTVSLNPDVYQLLKRQTQSVRGSMSVVLARMLRAAPQAPAALMPVRRTRATYSKYSSVRIDQDTHSELKRQALRHNATLSEMVETLIRGLPLSAALPPGYAGLFRDKPVPVPATPVPDPLS